MIGGGVQQVEAVAEARALGLRVIVTDRSPDAPALAAADEAVLIDGRDVEGLIGWSLLHRESLRIRGVFTISELVTSAACVAAAVGLPSAGVAETVACQNKALCKRLWLASGIPTPRGGPASTRVEARALLRALAVGPDRPAFVKPAVGFGAQGAAKIHSPEDPSLVDRFAGDGTPPWGPLMIEECVTGSMHDVSGLFDADGRFHPMGIVDRFFLPEHPVETGIRTPSSLEPEAQRALYALLEQGMRALGIEFGPVKGDAVRSGDGFRLLEVAPRLHGPKNSLMALPMSGFRPLRPTLRVLTGARPEPSELRIEPQCACVCRALLPAPGRLRRIDGVEEALRLPGIEHVRLFKKSGDTIRDAREAADVAGHVFATGATPEECERRLDAACARIRFETETWRRQPLAT